MRAMLRRFPFFEIPKGKAREGVSTQGAPSVYDHGENPFETPALPKHAGGFCPGVIWVLIRRANQDKLSRKRRREANTV